MRPKRGDVTVSQSFLEPRFPLSAAWNRLKRCAAMECRCLPCVTSQRSTESESQDVVSRSHSSPAETVFPECTNEISTELPPVTLSTARCTQGSRAMVADTARTEIQLEEPSPTLAPRLEDLALFE